MKKSFLLLTILSGLFFFSGCSKDNKDGKDDDNSGNQSASFYIKAKINGENYSDGVGISSAGGYVSISGNVFGKRPLIMISFPIDITVGTYDLSDDIHFGDYQAAFWDSSDNHYYSDNGSITITEYNTEKGLIKGTFQFTVEGYAITNGEFYAKLPVSDNKEPEVPNMTGKINGVSFSWIGDAQKIGDALSLRANAKGGNFMPLITLYVPSDVTAGQYPITGDGNYEAYYTNEEGFTNLNSVDNGMITITEHDKTKRTIKGTFYFSTSESLYTPAYIITDGSFSYVYEIIF
jgi:hypothetical protein